MNIVPDGGVMVEVVVVVFVGGGCSRRAAIHCRHTYMSPTQ